MYKFCCPLSCKEQINKPNQTIDERSPQLQRLVGFCWGWTWHDIIIIAGMRGSAFTSLQENRAMPLINSQQLFHFRSVTKQSDIAAALVACGASEWGAVHVNNVRLSRRTLLPLSQGSATVLFLTEESYSFCHHQCCSIHLHCWLCCSLNWTHWDPLLVQRSGEGCPMIRTPQHWFREGTGSRKISQVLAQRISSPHNYVFPGGLKVPGTENKAIQQSRKHSTPLVFFSWRCSDFCNTGQSILFSPVSNLESMSVFLVFFSLSAWRYR